MKHNIVKNPNRQEVNLLAIFTSVAEDLNSGLPKNKFRAGLQPGTAATLTTQPRSLRGYLG